MKKKILLSMILLALCLIQASADTYYFKINLFNQNGQLEGWSSYIKVEAIPDKVVDGKQTFTYPNGLKTLLDGGSVKDEGDGNGNNIKEYRLPKTTDGKVDLDRIYGIVFANGKGRDNKSTEENILEGYEYSAWETIRKHIKYLELREYKCDTYNNSGYFMDMHKVEALELPKDGMKVGSGDKDGELYFANADKLEKIYIYSTKGENDKVDITDNETDKVVAAIPLLNIVGKQMFSNCYSLSTKYINRLIRNVTEIKDEAFFAGNEHRGDFPDDAYHKMAIDIPSSVTKIGDRAFYNRLKVTGLNINGYGGCLEIGSEAFGQCDELATITLDEITQDNQNKKELKIYKNAFMRCKQLNAFKNMNTAKITSLGTGVFGECRSMTYEFVNNVLTNYATNGGTKIPAYLFFGCNGQEGHDGTVANKNKCYFTELNIPEQFTEIGDGAFASKNDAIIKLTTIRVNRDMAPTCLKGKTDEYDGNTEKSVFDGLIPNETTVSFETNATGWKETENETTGKKETTGFLTYMNDGSEFQRLLTKDIYSDHTAYINVPQQHAIVRLHRKLKEGWNTICLPFGVNNRYGSISDWKGYSDKQACNARIIVNGLTNNDSEANSNNFPMGVYRGYWPEGKTFMFLHYTKFDEYPLNLGETFLVKMRSQDIASNDTYTFTNVDLNYRWTAKGASGNEGEWTSEIYTAEQMPQQVKGFDGRVNTNEIPFKDKASYDDYVFKGSLVQHTGTVGDLQSIITTNDYFFQSKDGKMKLYPYKDNQTYGIRGFSGWFHHKTNDGNAKASELSLSLFDDGSITPIETVKVDDLNRDTSGKVYSISGVLVKNNAADLNSLSKGIYVVNGKKYVVK